MEILKLFLILSFFLTPAAHAKKRKKPARVKEKYAAFDPAPATEAEVKLLLDPDSVSDTVKWLKNQKAEFEQEHIFFFDTPDLALNQKGIFLRLSRQQDDTYDVTIKYRAQEVKNIPPTSSKVQQAFKCEADIPGDFPGLASCTYSKREKKVLGSVEDSTILAVLKPEQRSLLSWNAANIALKDLKSFGRINAARWTIRNTDAEIVYDLWSLPNGQRWLEISQRVSIEKAAETLAHLKKTLEEQKWKLNSEQGLKTSLVLKRLP